MLGEYVFPVDDKGEIKETTVDDLKQFMYDNSPVFRAALQEGLVKIPKKQVEQVLKVDDSGQDVQEIQ